MAKTSVEAAASVVKADQRDDWSEWVSDGNGGYTRPSNIQDQVVVTDPRTKWKYDPSNTPDWLLHMNAVQQYSTPPPAPQPVPEP